MGDLEKQEAGIKALRDQVAALNGGYESFRIRNKKGSLGISEDPGLVGIDSELDMVRDLIKEKKELAGLTKITVGGNGSTSLPDSDTSKKPIDTEEDRIERHIAKMNADSMAVNQNAGALEQLRVEAALYAAAERQGITDTEKYADKFYNLSQRAGDAALNLAKAKIAGDIKFSGDTSFLSPQDLQIAQQLKTTFGGDHWRWLVVKLQQ